MDGYTNCKITFTKNNEDGTYETSSYEEAIYGLRDYSDNIYVLSDGYVAFKSLDGKTGGWYDNEGNKVVINLQNFEISDVKNDKIILYTDIEEEEKREYYVFDMTGELILRTGMMYEIGDVYWIKNEQNKSIIVDGDFNQITDEYDTFIPIR